MKNFKLFTVKLSVLLGFCGFFFSSCSTDFDPNAEYKEIVVIYALLDPTETTHYIKVNKAFQNNRTSALTIAANNPDSTTYQNNIVVELQKLRQDSSLIATDTLSRTVVNTKKAGTFYGPEQVLYKAENLQLDQNAIYRVKVTNPKTGKIAYGATEIVQPICVTFFNTNLPNNCIDTTTVLNFNTNNTLYYTLSRNAGIYKIIIEFDYLETANGVTTPKTISYSQKTTFSKSYTNQVQIEGIKLDDFLRQLNTQIQTEGNPQNLDREAGLVRIKIIGGSNEFDTYYRVTNSYSALTQTVPEYSNVTGGIGLVASRFTNTVKARVTSPVLDSIRFYHPHLQF